MPPSYGDKDPIAAPATAPAESALAVIRVSGGQGGAVELLSRVFSRPEKLKTAPGNSVIHGWINAPQKIDEVMVAVYRAPKSYTGEESADISCHGGIASVKAVMAALRKAGFRDALPGEFTFRAFINGKLDLTRAESVMELVSAKTSGALEQAVRRLSGVLEKEISAIKALLVKVLAGTEIYLDYSEDEFLPPKDEKSETSGASEEEKGLLPERALAEDAASRLGALVKLWRRERIYAEGALAVIAGRPNAGKSSLFNYLIREDRSIVTETPGTTRDWIEEEISVEGIPLRLADTAGLRNLDDSLPENIDEAERAGIGRSLDLLGGADFVIYVINGVEGITAPDREFIEKRKKEAPEKPLLLLWNKADKKRPHFDETEISGLLPVSAKTGEGIGALLDSISALLQTPSSADFHLQNAAGPGSLRQKELIDSSLASLEEAISLADRMEPLDIIAPLLRSAVNDLGEITGEVSNADILETMFSRFCVGK